MSLSIPAIKAKSKAGRTWEPQAGLLCTCRKYTLVSELKTAWDPSLSLEHRCLCHQALSPW